MLGEHGGGRGCLAVEDLQRAIEHDVVIGRIQEDEIGRAHGVGGCLKPPHHVTSDQAGAFLEAEGVQVLAQDSKTARLLVHEGHVRRATGEGFDAERTRPREQVEDRRCVDGGANHVEDRLLDHALRRPDVLRRLQAAAPSLPPADPKP